jgi:DNA invertase Pin-like site-specific DNA recombinase
MTNSDSVFIYIRVSGKDQINGDGPVRQEKACRDYCAANGLTVAQVFFEKGVCGDVETMDRPAFIDMVAALMNGDVHTIIVEKLDRLSRHLITQETCIQDFQKQGYTLLSADPAEFDLMAEDPSRVLVRQLFGAIAQYDKAMLVVKLRVARKRLKLTGVRVEGQKPYGSREGESVTVQRIKTLRIEGYAYDRIAAILDAENVPTRKTGGKWAATQIRRILAA